MSAIWLEYCVCVYSNNMVKIIDIVFAEVGLEDGKERRGDVIVLRGLMGRDKVEVEA